jgi:excisionase family DNA binding protein
MDNFLTTYEAAALLGVWHTCVRQHIQKGNLRAIKFGRDYAIARADLEKFRDDRVIRKMYIR